MSRKIVVRTEDNEVWREFQGVVDCSEFFNVTKAVIYNRCATPNRLFLVNGINLKFESATIKVRVEGEQKEDGRLRDDSVAEAKLRKNETEDETRRRLGLNPYGEWRNDEWLNAMMERVNNRIYPDGYDVRDIWLAQKANNRAKKRAAIVREEKESEESFYNSIEEFNKNN